MSPSLPPLPEQMPADDDATTSSDTDDVDSQVLKVSEVLRQGQVWGPVWKAFMSDVSNAMLQPKCAEMNGAFTEKRPQVINESLAVEVHLYRKPQDWNIARRALTSTQPLYEKRIREFITAGAYDVAIHRACDHTASYLAFRLIVDVGV